MDKSLLTRILGFPATLIHGDTLVIDRWQWLKARLPITKNHEKLIDIGCGTGAFSIGAALRGYRTLGLSWNKRNQRVAGERAKLCRAETATFKVLDVRNLNQRGELINEFDIAICFETIEHIKDDKKLIQDIALCLKTGGRLLLTTPYLLYRPITSTDNGPFTEVEDGGHVRRGYAKEVLEALCKNAGLIPERISYCSGVLSQKTTMLFRVLSKFNPIFGWIIILPLRVLPVAFDRFATSLFQWPYYSICLEAYKPHYGGTPQKTGIQKTKD